MKSYVRRTTRWVVGFQLAVAVPATLLLGVGACGSRSVASVATETGNPPVIDEAKIRLESDGAAVRVVGQPGAVPANAGVEVTNTTSGDSATTQSDAAGAFEVQVDGQLGDELSVTVVGSVNGSIQLTSSSSEELAPVAPQRPADVASSSSGVNPSYSSATQQDGTDSCALVQEQATEYLAGEDLSWAAVDCAVDTDCQFFARSAPCSALGCGWTELVPVALSNVSGVVSHINNVSADFCDRAFALTCPEFNPGANCIAPKTWLATPLSCQQGACVQVADGPACALTSYQQPESAPKDCGSTEVGTGTEESSAAQLQAALTCMRDSYSACDTAAVYTHREFNAEGYRTVEYYIDPLDSGCELHRFVDSTSDPTADNPEQRHSRCDWDGEQAFATLSCDTLALCPWVGSWLDGRR